MFVFEHTGLYSHELSVYLSENKIPFLIVPGLEIKRSLGIARGKNDKVDATKIALYGYRLRDELKPYQMPSQQLLSLKRLLSLRQAKRIKMVCSFFLFNLLIISDLHLFLDIIFCIFT